MCMLWHHKCPMTLKVLLAYRILLFLECQLKALFLLFLKPWYGYYGLLYVVPHTQRMIWKGVVIQRCACNPICIRTAWCCGLWLCAVVVHCLLTMGVLGTLCKPLGKHVAAPLLTMMSRYVVLCPAMPSCTCGTTSGWLCSYVIVSPVVVLHRNCRLASHSTILYWPGCPHL